MDSTKITIIVVILAILVGGGVAGYFYYQKKAKEEADALAAQIKADKITAYENKVYSNQSFEGGHLGTYFPGTSTDVCKVSCQQKPDCVGWIYDNVNCTLKKEGSEATLKTHPGYSSGFRYREGITQLPQ